MRYALHLLPNVCLLVALLRMTFVHLHRDRPAIFLFLVCWLAYSLACLFVSQVHAIDSDRYAGIFVVLTAIAWLCGLPALVLAGNIVRKNLWHALGLLGVMACVAAAGRLVNAHPSISLLAKAMALNCWIAVLFGAFFVCASISVEDPDKVLWRCGGIFFLLFGFGYLSMWMIRPNSWAYPALLLLCAMAWAFLAWRVGANPDALFNLEKLGLTAAAFRIPAVLTRIIRG